MAAAGKLPKACAAPLRTSSGVSSGTPGHHYTGSGYVDDGLLWDQTGADHGGNLIGGELSGRAGRILGWTSLSCFGGAVRTV